MYVIGPWTITILVVPIVLVLGIIYALTKSTTTSTMNQSSNRLEAIILTIHPDQAPDAIDPDSHQASYAKQQYTPTPHPAGPPKNWLVESILVTLFCCLPFGIVGIINATNVNSKFAAGDVAGAAKASEEAKKWMKIGFFIGIGVIVLYLIYSLVIGGAALRLLR